MSLKRVSLALALAVGISGCIVAPMAFAAKNSSYKVSIKSLSKQHSTSSGTTLSGTWSDAKLGKGTLTGTLKIPLTKLTYARKGYGTFSTTTYHCAKEKFSPPTFAGCWKVTKATGTFAGMTGGGTFTGNIDGHSVYVGAVKY